MNKNTIRGSVSGLLIDPNTGVAMVVKCYRDKESVERLLQTDDFGFIRKVRVGDRYFCAIYDRSKDMYDKDTKPTILDEELNRLACGRTFIVRPMADEYVDQRGYDIRNINSDDARYLFDHIHIGHRGDQITVSLFCVSEPMSEMQELLGEMTRRNLA